MSKGDLNVHQGDDGQWRAKRQGATRASVVANTQRDAFERARELAQDSDSEVSIHRRDNGHIRDKHSYGNDPESSKG